ncbi:hypothetical protein D9757_011942 [Collybiopsis confluens]|uniref:Uncharacterized protein n=1 Tax=Collybiopsis confluens TaxID=2823264 RepID=A0A8H5G3J0_9AGAR|nr:hypothetical protein D9757_011942 [Collybiopsis confluens]
MVNFPSPIAVPVQCFLAPSILALAAFVFIIRQTPVHEALPSSHDEAAVPTISDFANGTKKAPLKQDINAGKGGVKTQKSTLESSQNLKKAHLGTENASIIDALGQPQEGHTIVVSEPSVLEAARGLRLRNVDVEQGAMMAIYGNLCIGDGQSQGQSQGTGVLRIPSNSTLFNNPSVLRNAEDTIFEYTKLQASALTAVNGNVYIERFRPGQDFRISEPSHFT